MHFRSIELYRQNLRRQSGEDSPESSPDPEQPESCDQSSQQDHVAMEIDDNQNTEPIATEAESMPTTQPIQNEDMSTDKSSNLTPCATPETSFSDVSQSDISIEESPASTKKTKAKTRRGKRKREPSVEDIYQNKLWRTQMPKEKNWETIYEEPKENKKGAVELISSRKFKRLMDFEESYTLNKMKKRRQKAKKQGWKPLSKAKNAKMERLVEEKIMALDAELMDIEESNTSIAETLATLGEPEVVAAKMDASCVSSPSKQPLGISVIAEVHEPEHGLKLDIVKTLDNNNKGDPKESNKGVSSKKKGKKSLKAFESSLDVISEGSELDNFHSSKPDSLQQETMSEPSNADHAKVNPNKLLMPEQSNVTSRSMQNESVFFTPCGTPSEHDNKNSGTNRKYTKKAASLAPSCGSIPEEVEEEDIFYTPAKTVSEMVAYKSPAETHSIPVATHEIDNSGVKNMPHSSLPEGQGHTQDDSAKGSAVKEETLSPNSSGGSGDSLALHKTSRHEEVADISGIEILSP